MRDKVYVTDMETPEELVVHEELVVVALPYPVHVTGVMMGED